jgi:hypothetical protein
VPWGVNHKISRSGCARWPWASSRGRNGDNAADAPRPLNSARRLSERFANHLCTGFMARPCSTDERDAGEMVLLKKAASFSSAASPSDGCPSMPSRSRMVLSYCSRVSRRSGRNLGHLTISRLITLRGCADAAAAGATRRQTISRHDGSGIRIAEQLALAAGQRCERRQDEREAKRGHPMLSARRGGRRLAETRFSDERAVTYVIACSEDT